MNSNSPAFSARPASGLFFATNLNVSFFFPQIFPRSSEYFDNLSPPPSTIGGLAPESPGLRHLLPLHDSAGPPTPIEHFALLVPRKRSCNTAPTHRALPFSRGTTTWFFTFFSATTIVDLSFERENVSQLGFPSPDSCKPPVPPPRSPKSTSSPSSGTWRVQDPLCSPLVEIWKTAVL